MVIKFVDSSDPPTLTVDEVRGGRFVDGLMEVELISAKSSRPEKVRFKPEALFGMRELISRGSKIMEWQSDASHTAHIFVSPPNKRK